MYVHRGDTQTKWRIQMTKGTEQHNMGRADAVSKYECVGIQKNGQDFLIRQALRGGNVYEWWWRRWWFLLFDYKFFFFNIIVSLYLIWPPALHFTCLFQCLILNRNSPLIFLCQVIGQMDSARQSSPINGSVRILFMKLGDVHEHVWYIYNKQIHVKKRFFLFRNMTKEFNQSSITRSNRHLWFPVQCYKELIIIIIIIIII